MRFEDITVGQYQALYSISKSEMDEWDKVTESVAVITGKSTNEVEEMPVHEFNKLAHDVVRILSTEIEPKPKKIIKANGKAYGITYEPAKLTRAQYVEIQYFLSQQEGVINNLHLILSSLSYPVERKFFFRTKGKNDSSKHSEVSEDMKEAKMIDAYSACVFFCELFRVSINSLWDYLAKELKMTTKEIEPLLTAFNSVTDGFIQPMKLQKEKE